MGREPGILGWNGGRGPFGPTGRGPRDGPGMPPRCILRGSDEGFGGREPDPPGPGGPRGPWLMLGGIGPPLGLKPGGWKEEEVGAPGGFVFNY